MTLQADKTTDKKQIKVIITCAATGATRTPLMSSYWPINLGEIMDVAVGARKAGAAIIHLHTRDPITGKSDQSPEVFEKFLLQIKSKINAVLNLISGGTPRMTVEERIQPAIKFSLEVASLNMGSMNFGLYRMWPRFGILGLFAVRF